MLDRKSAVRPVVLVTPDLSTGGAETTETEYVVRANYCGAIAEAGGIPLIVPYDSNDMGSLLAIADGVVVTGSRPGVTVAPEREAFEATLIEAALDAGIPLLGICHGMQLLGCTLGGHLVRQIPGNDFVPPTHIPTEAPVGLAHPISLAPAGLLASLASELNVEVNSLHRHGLQGPGRFRVIAHAEDGVIEAIEGESSGLSLGIQWHPEYRLTALDREIFAMFIMRCEERMHTAKSI